MIDQVRRVAELREWEVTLSVTFTTDFPIEDGEDKEAFRKWLQSKEGCAQIERELKGIRFNHRPYSHNAEINIDDIVLLETEVKSTDTDPRV